MAIMDNVMTCANSSMLTVLLFTVLLTTARSNPTHSRRRQSNANEEEQRILPCASDIPHSAYVSPRPQTTCEQERHQGGTSCPYEFEITTDENRLPTQMAEAKCQCRRCQLPLYLRGRPFRCLPIYHMVPVMRRSPDHTGQNGGWVYTLERVSVGCTCGKVNRNCTATDEH